MKYSILFFGAFFFASCNNRTTPENNTEDTIANTPQTKMDTSAATSAGATTCYTYQTATDTVRLTLTQTGQTVSGTYATAYSGKDKNSGTLNGVMRGDTLLADYNFMSEGKTSVRQVAFLKKGDGFVEGYGDSKMEGTKMVFKNTGALSFGDKMVLQKTVCTK